MSLWDETGTSQDESTKIFDEAMHCLIVDDDPLICDLLKHFCSKVDFIETTTVTNSGFESVNLINQKTFDLILLDYDLPDITGKDILKLIGAETVVIMITSHKDFASESYEYDQVIDFLVKPIDFPRFFKGVQKARKMSSGNQDNKDRLFIKDGNKLVKVDLQEVLFIKSAANYAELVFDGKKVMTLMTMKELESKLPSYFQRVHRSYIVNVNKIETIANGDLMIGKEEISVSESYEKELLKKISLLN